MVRLAGSAILAALTLASLQVLCAPNTDYSIMSWPYGVVIWPGTWNTHLTMPESFVDRLTAAAEEAFSFWGYDAPEPLGDWEAQTRFSGRLRVVSPHDVRIVDDETGNETLVPALRWENRRLHPFVVIPFVGEWRMYDALGSTARFAAQFFYRPLTRSVPDAEAWVHEVGRGHRTMICASYAGTDVLIHEFAHWFQWEWCSASGVEPLLLPGFIREGMAETTAACAESSPYAAWERQAVIDWAERHCLSGGVGQASLYTVGESLVTYLVGKLGREGFLQTLPGWVLTPEALIERHEPGWRTSLELPAECETDPAPSDPG